MPPTVNQAFVFDLPYESDFLLNTSSKLSSLPWTMLLHSGDSDHPDSQFDILVSHPKFTLVTELLPVEMNRSSADGLGMAVNGSNSDKWSNVDSVTTLTEYGADFSELYEPRKILSTQKVSGDPFEILDQIIKSHDWRANPCKTIPFQGGALGVFGYDLARTQELIDNTADKIDELPAMAVGIYDLAWIHDKVNMTLKCVIQAESQVHASERFARLKLMIETPVKASCLERFKLTAPFVPLITPSQYHQQFNRIQEALRSGDCYQINLTQAFKTYYQGPLWNAFIDLLKANQAPFSAYCVLPQGVILSASPERFLKLDKGLVSTKPIKGTMPRSEDLTQDEYNKKWLQNSEKNRAENVMIVDLLRNDIGKIAKPGSVRVPHLFDIESFPAVHHLVSTVTGQLPDSMSAALLLKACFPGGSITGAPKVSAMQIIESLEPTQRSIYCGTIGYISACGNMDSNIAIRTLIATPQASQTEEALDMTNDLNVAPTTHTKPELPNKGTLLCFAGGGIVLDSVAEEEYQEVYAKLSKILSLWNSEKKD